MNPKPVSLQPPRRRRKVPKGLFVGILSALLLTLVGYFLPLLSPNQLAGPRIFLLILYFQAVVLTCLSILISYAYTTHFDVNELSHEVAELQDALQPTQLLINVPELHSQLSAFVEEVNVQVRKGGGPGTPSINKATRLMSHFLAITRHGSYHKINDVHVLHDFFAEAQHYAVAVSTAQILGLLAPPYFLYLIEHGQSAGKLNRTQLDESKLSAAHKLADLLEPKRFLSLRFYCYPRREFIENQETFPPLLAAGRLLRIDTFPLVYEKLQYDAQLRHLIRAARDIMTDEARDENGDLEFTPPPTPITGADPLPDFLLTDKAVVFVLYQNNTDEPRHFKICKDRDLDKHRQFVALLDHLISGVRNDSFA